MDYPHYQWVIHTSTGSPGMSACSANSGVRYDRYHYHGVARVVGVLSIVVVGAEIEILEVALNSVVVETVGPNFAVEVAGPTPVVVVVGMATAWRKLEQMRGLHELYDRCECDAGCRGLSAQPGQ